MSDDIRAKARYELTFDDLPGIGHMRVSIEVEIGGAHDGDVAEKAPPRKRAAAQEHRMPGDWCPKQETVDKLAAEYPHVDLWAEAGKCRDHFLDRPTIRRAGWERTFVKWVATAVEKGWAAYVNGRAPTSTERKMAGYGEVTQRLLERKRLEETVQRELA